MLELPNLQLAFEVDQKNPDRHFCRVGNFLLFELLETSKGVKAILNTNEYLGTFETLGEALECCDFCLRYKILYEIYQFIVE